MTVYEIGDGQRICPYHFHWGSDAFLIALEGEPIRRGAPAQYFDGER